MTLGSVFKLPIFIAWNATSKACKYALQLEDPLGEKKTKAEPHRPVRTVRSHRGCVLRFCLLHPEVGSEWIWWWHPPSVVPRRHKACCPLLVLDVIEPQFVHPAVGFVVVHYYRTSIKGWLWRVFFEILLLALCGSNEWQHRLIVHQHVIVADFCLRSGSHWYWFMLCSICW